MSKEKNRAFQQAVSESNKTFGAGTVIQIGKTKIPPVPSISTGILGIDRAIGCGGFPRGRMTELAGAPGGGKTTLCLSTIAQAQMLGEEAVFIDAEHSLDLRYARTLGVQIEKLALSQPDYGEQALQIMETFLKSYSCGIIVVDSVAALTPKVVIDGEIGDANVAVLPRMMSQAVSKILSTLRKSNTCLIFINQIRDKINTFGHGDPRTTPGGWALKHHAALRVSVDRISSLKKGDRVIGARTKFRMPKNKVGGFPYNEVEADLMYGTGFSREADLIDIATKFGVLEKAGSHYSIGGERIGNGREETRLALLGNPEWFDKIRQMTVDKIAERGRSSMTLEENMALDALAGVSMRIASAGKRFRNDLLWYREHNEEYKLTARQALYLWFLVDMYRRQIKDDFLKGWGAYRKMSGELPPIYKEGDHREPIVRTPKGKRVKKVAEHVVAERDRERTLFGEISHRP